MNAMKKAIAMGASLLFFVPLLLTAGTQKGAMEIHLVKKDVSRPLREIPPAARPAGVKRVHPNPHFIENLPFQQDGALQTFAATSPDAPTAGPDFEGIGEGIPGYSVCCVPPDTNGDVGANHYVQTVNIDYAVFNKNTSARVLGPLPTNTIWSGFGGGCQSNNDGDPVVVYDQFNDRWVVTQFSVATKPYLECVAVSTSPDPTGSYYRYAYSFGNKDFPDYPKVAVWPTEDAYFITYNVFGTVFFKEPRVCAYQMSKLVAGQANTAQCFGVGSSYSSMLPADLDGTKQPALGTDEYIIARNGSGLVSWRANINWSNSASSTLSGASSVAGVASYSTACSGGGSCIPQNGSSTLLDSLGDRLMHRAAYRVFADHESLVANHSVTAPGTTGVRWYELRPSGNGLSVFQQGTFSPDSTHRWMGSIAMDKAGDIALGYSASSSNIKPGIRYTGRIPSDSAGTMQAEATIINGTGAQTTYDRWGDYSALTVDTDDCTFWYTTEYLTQTNVFNWHTRIASFQFGNCTGGGGGGNNPPTASFTYNCTALSCNFTDTSTDPDGNNTIGSWAWNFGDTSSINNTSTSQNPTHDFSSTGTYTVQLMVTDDHNASDSTSQTVMVTMISLTAVGNKFHGTKSADLTWTGTSPTVTDIDVYRDGSLIDTTPNDGAYTDTIGKGGPPTSSYQVCEAGTSNCSNISVASF